MMTEIHRNGDEVYFRTNNFRCIGVNINNTSKWYVVSPGKYQLIDPNEITSSLTKELQRLYRNHQIDCLI